jgi:DNA-binding response OmpR family regulator
VARILVVDDEKLVALMIRRALEDGHEVVVEHSAAAARALLATGRFDAVIADLHLPDGSAASIRDELKRLHPALASRLLVLTGGATTAKESDFLREPGVRWLHKPFRAAELLARLEELLPS